MIVRLKRSLARIFKRTVSRIVSYINEGAGLVLIKRFCKNLLNQLPGKATYKFLELLLDGMDLAFSVLPGYSKNIKDFKGRYLFKTKEIETESNWSTSRVIVTTGIFVCLSILRCGALESTGTMNNPST